MAVQGAKHMIWDEIIKEANKFRPYLDFIADHESALKMARQNMLIVKKGLNKRKAHDQSPGRNQSFKGT